MAKRFLILSDTLGGGNDELGSVLMKNFLYSLARAEVRPNAVAFMNEGVRLACKGSDSIDDLELLVDNGVSVKACGTCLDFLGMKDQLVVGEIGTMVASVDGLLGPDEIVTIA